MFWSVLMYVFYLLGSSQCEYYLPAIVWDLRNPLLQKEYWKQVVNLRTFDIVTFVCPNTKLYMAGSESAVSPLTLNQNLYVKEIPADIENFNGACDIKGAKFITTCDKPEEFVYKKIQISENQARPNLPTFQHGKDYMFFATSDGTIKTLNSTKNCTMIFRIHYNEKNEEREAPSCFLLGRKEVCQGRTTARPTTVKPTKHVCTNAVPQAITATKKTNTTLDIEWKEPLDTSCNITGYGLKYTEVANKEVWKELLVLPQKNNLVTLDHLKPSSNYKIRIRVYMCESLGNYSELVVSLTGTAAPPVISKRVSNEGTSLDVLSLFIGIIIGVIISVVCIVVYYCFRRRRQTTCKDNEDRHHDKKDPNDNARFQQEDEDNMEEVALNIGYRDSVLQQGWKLPQITEEDKSSSRA